MATTKDKRSADDFLNDRVKLAETKVALQEQTLEDKPSSASEALHDVVVNIPDKNIRLKKLHKRAQSIGASSPELESKEQAEEDQAALEQEEDQSGPRPVSIAGVRRSMNNAASAASDATQPLIDRVGALPTVGGIGILLLILFLLLFLVVRVNEAGDTRAKQLWYMLNGRASIRGRVTPIHGSQGDTGAGSTFGDTSNTANPVNATTAPSVHTPSNLVGF